MKDEIKTKAKLIEELKFLRLELEKEAFRDIISRKEAIEDLKESENRFRELFYHMSSSVAIYEAKDKDQDFIFKDFNQARERIEKIKKEDIIGKSDLQVFPRVKDMGLFQIF